MNVSEMLLHIANDGCTHFTEIELEKQGFYMRPNVKVFWDGSMSLRNNISYFDCYINNVLTPVTYADINAMRIKSIHHYFHAKHISEADYLESLSSPNSSMVG